MPGSFTALAGNSVANSLDDQQLPSVIPYVRSAGGNSAPPVTPDQIKTQR